MINFNQCNLEIDFEYGSCNNKLFNVTVCCDTDCHDMIPVNNKSTFQKYIALPCRLTITTSGKNHLQDTIVDNEANIVEDLYVKITRFALDGFMLNEKFLHQKIQITTTNGDVYTTCYFGFNGVITLDLMESSVFAQVLTFNN